MLDGEVSITRRILWLLASGAALVVLAFLAWLLGFLDDPRNEKTVFAVVTAIWMVIWLVLYVVITKVGQAPDRDE